MNATQLQNLAAIELGTNYLRIPSELPKEKLSEIFDTLKHLQGSTLFWLGDFLNTIEIRYGETYKALLEATDYDPGTLQVAKSVCKKLPPEVRLNLSYSHHKEALVESKGDSKLALKYLKEAQEAGLKVRDMRKAIRLESMDPKADEVRDAMPELDTEWLNVQNAFVTMRHYLGKVTSSTERSRRTFLIQSLEELSALASKVCQ